ncbi:MAG TPA: sulfur carrier protein ThiS [Terriglobia bacterium]|nr:sulfur carrier protein ThiS [Terriglobia bacterium]
MTIQLNGEQRQVPEGLTLAGLLEWLGLAPDRVAVELNREIVKRSQWSTMPIVESDRLEVVQMVGGGSGRRNLP